MSGFIRVTNQYDGQVQNRENQWCDESTESDTRIIDQQNNCELDLIECE